MALNTVKNDALSRAESHVESYENSQRALLRQRLSAATQDCFKLGTNSPGPSVPVRPRDLDSEKRRKRKRLRSPSGGHQQAGDLKTEKQNFSLLSAVTECQALLEGKEHRIKKPECSVDDSASEGPSRKKFKHGHDFGSTFIKPQYCDGHQSGSLIPPVTSSSHNTRVSMVTPFRRDESIKTVNHPVMGHYGFTHSLEDSSFEGPPKKRFNREGIDQVSTLVPLWQQQTIEDMKRSAQRERQEAARVTHMGLDCNILAHRADSRVLQIYKELDRMWRF
ncbi:hypothetical protein DPX16_0938 [Anabarilius grahami]|uniref:Uncharacterized protein n=1 Tax=Anabarilius grahami TaxID=495550 RepID=A0A3N0XMK6_ANAGA|nr:hypothetical protein DPX16_0938 [Anabarilius grahami]